ncbi:MAG: hypothetical protein EON58_08485 [Alphaproteobacteria bacterium]|nr:MAG: hypothetical protein EON58_08485 [Alphaproteobacteria bacterium]
MWPSVLPKQTRDDIHREAEVRVYDLLARELGPEWTIFYSRPWLGLTSSGGEIDGEADFVVVHPVRGYLTIEVKGGAISYDPEKDQWRTRDRHKIFHNIKDPVFQARTCKYELLKKVKAAPSWPGRFVRKRHGVVFTDAMEPPSDLGPDRPRELFCCRAQLADIGSWVRQRLSGGDEDPLGPAGVEAFHEVLASRIELTVPLAHYLDDDEQTIITLTPQQFHVFNSVAHLPRVAAGGGAGTGKTILATEDAVRLAAAGMRTALICLSAQLADHLRQRVKGHAVEVWNFGDLCMHIAEEAGIAGGGADGGMTDGLADHVSRAIAIRPDLKFDAIVVDEAQDFRSPWWVALDELLVKPGTSLLHAFYDTNQSVYGDVTGELASFSIIPIRLTRNLRNTQNIHTTASRFYRGSEITADGPEGTEVEWVQCTTGALETKVIEIVRNLTEAELVFPENIVVLAVDGPLIERLRKRTAAFDGLTVEHVREFKGLERQVVILAATKDIADFPELAYVALSRARVHLTVLGDPEILKWLEGV